MNFILMNPILLVLQTLQLLSIHSYHSNIINRLLALQPSQTLPYINTMKPNNPFPTTGSKQRIIDQSKQKKLQKARSLSAEGAFYQAIEMYHKVLFLSQKPEYLIELAQIYEKELMDVSSAVLFYRRALHLKPKNTVEIKEKLKELVKIKGLQLLEMGGCKNILDCSYLQDEKGGELLLMQQFKKTYPSFHHRLISTYIRPSSKPLQPHSTFSSLKTTFIPNSPIKDYLESTLAYLQVNHRQFAMSELENCLMIEDKNVDVMVLKALMEWSMLEREKGYKVFWDGFRVDRSQQEVALFLRLILPQVEELYKEAKYDLIQGNIDKCKLKVIKGLQMHPYHTQLLILKAFLHRSKEQYKMALQCLETANSHLPEPHSSPELKTQISLTYNEMAIYLFKQQKYKQAIDLFTEGLKFNPQDYGLYTNRGDCHKAMNQFVKALEDYLLAYEIEKKSPQLNFRISTIYSIRGVSLFNSKNYELALREFEESLRFTPKNQQFIASKVKCLIQLNRKQEAIDLLSESVKMNPNFTEIKTLLAQVKQPEEKRGPNNRKIIQLSKEKS